VSIGVYLAKHTEDESRGHRRGVVVAAKLKMVAYCRVSTGKQAKSGLGLEAQKRNITATAELQGWEIVGWKVDRGETGKNTDRAGFKAALELIADGKADGLVVAKLDRVCRSVIDFAQLLEWFASGKKVLAILDPAIDTSTPSGRLVANVFAAVAEWEADVIAERTSSALSAKRSSGLSISRPAVVDDAALAGRIRAMRDKGLSLGAIAEQLNADGIPTLRGGAEWRASAVQSALGYKRPKTRKPADLPVIRRRRAA
jgi:DNA invertase Pin-like site-specific DNA recombinase